MKLIIKKLAEMASKKSDHNNGYYIQSEKWGTTFHRWMQNPDANHIHMYYNAAPNFIHTYTRIPAKFQQHVYFVYVNYTKDKSVQIKLSQKGRVIGLDHPQESGKYLNRSFLIYDPWEEPRIILLEKPAEREQFYLIRLDEEIGVYPYLCDIDFFFRGRENQRFWLDENGYHILKQHETIPQT